MNIMIFNMQLSGLNVIVMSRMFTLICSQFVQYVIVLNSENLTVLPSVFLCYIKSSIDESSPPALTLDNSLIQRKKFNGEFM